MVTGMYIKWLLLFVIHTEMKVDIRNCLVQAENCLQLLLPEPESFDISGLQSPDALKNTTNGLWTTPNTNNRRKSKDGTNCKKSRRRSKETNNVSVLSNLDETVDVKPEICNQCSKTILSSGTDISKDNIGACHCQRNNAANASTVVSVECLTNVEKQTEKSRDNSGSDSDEFLEITDSSDSESSCEDYDDEKVKEESHYLRSLDNVRQHGVGSHSFNLNVELTDSVIQIDETPDNQDIINALRDSVQLAENKFLPCLQKFLDVSHC